MAALVVGGVTVKVAVGGVSRRRVEIGDRVRAFGGRLRSSIRARKWEWAVTTPAVPVAEASTYLTAIETVPVSCSGDALGGTVSCHGTLTGWNDAGLPGGTHVIVSFDLLEV